MRPSPASVAAATAFALSGVQLGGSHGLTTGPKALVSLEEPIANSSQFNLPSITAPSRQSCALTVDS